jgi:hypothetical protein
MRRLQIFVPVLACAALLSCEAFLAPVLGRFNPLDPANELIPYDAELLPTVDGWVEDSGSAYFDQSTLLLNGASAPNTRVLLLFDLSGAPALLEKAELKLYCASVRTPPFTVETWRILRPWTPTTTMDWYWIIGSEFTDMAYYPPPGVEITTESAGNYVSLDVTDYVHTMLEQKQSFGFLLSTYPGYYGDVEFEASSNGNQNPPKLHLVGLSYP